MAAAPTVNIAKFDAAFQGHPNFSAIVTQINQSPSLVDAINSFQGTIEQGGSGTGGGFTSDPDPTLGSISIDKDWIDSTTGDNAYQDKFITMLGHEIGHAVLPGGDGLSTPPTTPQAGLTSYLESEGVALTMEYQVARELNVPMWSDPDGSLKAGFDALATRHGVDTPSFNEAAYTSDAKQFGAQQTGSWTPSIAPNLTYSEYYLAANVVNLCSGSPLNSQTVDWANAKPSDITFTNDPAGNCTYTGSLPALSHSGGTPSPIRLEGVFPEQLNSPYLQHPTQEKPSSQELSPEIQALHDKIGGFLYPTLEKSNVSQNHADAMVATAVQEAVGKNISADEVMHAGVDKTKNLIGVFTKEVYKVAAFDAVEASKNDPEKTLQHAQQQLEQQPAQEQQRQQQLEQQTKERSGQSMGI